MFEEQPFYASEYSPLMAIKAKDTQIISKIPLQFYSFEEQEDTPFNDLNYTAFQKAKYWSVIENLKGTEYKIKKIVCSQYLDTYYIQTPNGEEIYKGYYKNSGRYNFTPQKNNYIHADKIMCFLTDEYNYKIKYNYNPEGSEFEQAHKIINDICNKNKICITNIYKENYTIIYCLKSPVSFILLKIKHNSYHRITNVVPSSTLGDMDIYIPLFTKAICEIRKEDRLSIYANI